MFARRKGMCLEEELAWMTGICLVLEKAKGWEQMMVIDSALLKVR